MGGSIYLRCSPEITEKFGKEKSKLYYENFYLFVLSLCKMLITKVIFLKMKYRLSWFINPNWSFSQFIYTYIPTYSLKFIISLHKENEFLLTVTVYSAFMDILSKLVCFLLSKQTIDI